MVISKLYKTSIITMCYRNSIDGGLEDKIYILFNAMSLYFGSANNLRVAMPGVFKCHYT